MRGHVHLPADSRGGGGVNRLPVPLIPVPCWCMIGFSNGAGSSVLGLTEEVLGIMDRF